ncbi:hypothetical protein [Bacillus sp. SG-1]|uniref:hypothetical protein n=1 Tax=Bacillus sp. SG-1 TaxID=161544 RepID=UPI0002FF3270|nr:hypothetical protein [Bacillus sp. SG-1]
MRVWILCIVIAAISIFALSVKAAFSHRHTPLLTQKELKEAIKRQKEEEQRSNLD